MTNLQMLIIYQVESNLYQTYLLQANVNCENNMFAL